MKISSNFLSRVFKIQTLLNQNFPTNVTLKVYVPAVKCVPGSADHGVGDVVHWYDFGDFFTVDQHDPNQGNVNTDDEPRDTIQAIGPASNWFHGC